MFSFKPKIEFKEFPPQIQFEKIVEKYLAPKLQLLGFKWTKEELFSDESQRLIEQEIKRKLPESEKISPQYFEREMDGFTHTLILKRDLIKGDLCFDVEVGIGSTEHLNWHIETYGEEPYTNEIYFKADGDFNGIGSKYKTEFNYIQYFNLGKYSTEKVMSLFWKQTELFRLPFFEEYSNWPILFNVNEKEVGHYTFPILFDISVREGNYKRAGQILKWAENCFLKDGEKASSINSFNIRLKYLSTLISKAQ